MKSIQEARQLIEDGTAVYRKARRQSEVSRRAWSEYTEATKKRKTQALRRKLEECFQPQSLAGLRSIEEIYMIQQELRRVIRENYCEGDEGGKRCIDKKVEEFNAFLSSIYLPSPLPSSKSACTEAWKKVKDRVKAEDEERERLALVSEFGLHDQVTLKKARNAAKRIFEERRREEERITEERRRAEEARQAEEYERETRERLGLDSSADAGLAAELTERANEEIRRLPPQGYLYFRCWVMPDGTRWYKVGITNDLRRREAEQNVLPVAMETLAYATFDSYEHARAAEQAFHAVLGDRRIRGAQNRELFHLEPSQAMAVLAAIANVGSS